MASWLYGLNRRSISLMLGLAMLGGLLGVSPQKAEAAELSEVPTIETFDTGQTGLAPAGYTVTGTGGTALISESAGAGNKTLELKDTDSTNAGVAATKTFTPLVGGKALVETKYLLKKDTTNIIPLLSVRLNGKMGASTTVKPAVQFAVLGNGAPRFTIKEAPDPFEGQFIPNSSYSISENFWYTMQLVLDLDEGTFDAYLTSEMLDDSHANVLSDGITRVGPTTVAMLGKPLVTTGVTSIDQIVFSTGVNSGSYHIDNVMIKRITPKLSNQYDPIPIPQNDRPRVLVNKDMLPTLIARVTDPAFDTVWNSINTNAQKSVTGILPVLPNPIPNDVYTNLNNEAVEVMKANAIRYLIYGDVTARDKAADLAVNLATTVQWNGNRSDGTIVFNVGRQMGSLMFFTSLVYDWCYDSFSAAERTTIRGKLDDWVKTALEYPYPIRDEDKYILAGHVNGEVHHQFKLAMAIALFDTNPEYYEDLADYILNVSMPGFNVMLDSEMPFEGPAYGDNRLKYIMMGNQLWKAIGIEPLTEKVGLALDRQVFTRRPDGYIMTEGDDFNTDAIRSFHRFNHGNITNMIAGSVYNNPKAQNEFIKQKYIADDLYYLLFFDPNAPKQSEYDTPLSRYFPAPYGSIVARTGWDEGTDSKAVFAVMNIGERLQTNHQHFDAGAFSLYYKGYLAIDSGIYSGKDPATGDEINYGSVHDLQYNKQSIAHNVVQIEDPTASQQGTYSPSNQLYNTQIPRTVEQWNTDSGYHRGEILSHSIGDDEMHPDYSYIKGELSSAYGNTGLNPRAENYTRSMAFLNFKDDEHPAAMVVYDNIDTPNANAEKRWLLHTINEPVVTGNRTTSVVTERGYYNGKLVTDTLLPQSSDLNVEKIGGPGCVNELNGSCAFEVDGVNKPIIAREQSDIAGLEAGKWRLELSSETPANRTRFLNVMQVMDAAGGPAPLDVHYSETNDYAGARIHDRVVFFAKDFDLVDQQATITFTGQTNQNYKILVTDLEDGYWTAVKQGGTATVKYEAVQEGNTIYFEGTPGTYTLQKADSSTLPLAAQVPSEPVERKIRVRIDTQGLDLDVAPMLNNTLVMVPMRGVLEEMGMTVNWNAATNTATATKGNLTIQFVSGSNVAKVNGINMTMDAQATGANNQMLIPDTFIQQSGLRYTVAWNAENQVVEFTSQKPLVPLQLQTQALAPVTPIPLEDLKEIKFRSFRATYSPQNVWKMFDNDAFNESRWSGDKTTYLLFNFGETIQLERFDATVFNWGDTRSNKLMLSVSEDGETWTNVYGGTTAAGNNGDVLSFNFPSVNTKYFRVAVFGSLETQVENPEWVSFSEMKFFVKK
ncbi:Heparinase II/III-like protein [Paenibacillus sp. UNCCL117]|uniref:stalk domain-containing protein n=1 Tax=unclassified Paenibacillus TaxID=185978 RepID=UPI000885441E|nr:MULTISPECIES: stalk domain-containing protein [unclassified Paenibacillus]SDD05018.1 Heparinase II/III-like protein [Paenibacillus sp. cl123]SFW31954.1 Heparinase II/III-like protein [Paenibacillus sp. UNCCL117]